MSNRDESGHLSQPVGDPACIEVPVIELILARAADATLTHSRAWASVPKVGAGALAAHVRFDERGVETELRPGYMGTANRKGRQQTNRNLPAPRRTPTLLRSPPKGMTATCTSVGTS